MALLVTGAMGSVSDGASLYGAQSQNTTVNTLEQMYSPILIRKGGSSIGAISGFESPGTATMESGYFGNNQVGPTRLELDPYFSNALGDDGTNWIKECDYQIMVNDGTASKGDADLNIRKTDRDIENVSVTALRGPLILSGWGFDVCDKPVPRESSGSSFSFDQNVANDRGTWKTGPVNLQWDDQRKVWQGGAQVLCGVASGKIPAPTDPCNPTTFIVKVLRVGNSDIINSCDAGETITCTNRDPSLTQDAVSGMVFVVAVRLNYEWIPIWVGCPDGPAPEPLPTCTDC